MSVAFGLNRFDYSSPAAFAADARRAEALGWAWAFIPSSPLRRLDPYVMLAAVAGATERIGVGPLIETPMMRHPAVLAGSIATLDALAPGRTLVALGAGDTAVRLIGRRPAKVAELEHATWLVRRLLAGEAVAAEALATGEARAGRGAPPREPARLAHARPVPVWVAAGGPRTLRMAGRVADGVFLRVGRHPANLRAAAQAVRAGAREAGRDPATVRLGAIFHTVLTADRERALTIGRSMAAGYYEYSPRLFDAPGLRWEGPDVHALQRRVWPDFHHHPDLVASGGLVSFLPDAAADAFAVHGDADAVAAQIAEALAVEPAIEIVVPHPVPVERPSEPRHAGPDYIEAFAREVMPRLRGSSARVRARDERPASAG